MAEGTTPDDDGLFKSKKVDGRYVIPWADKTRMGFGSVLKWVITETDLSGVGGTWREGWKFKEEELNRNLPVLEPNFEAIKNPSVDQLQVTWIGHATCLVQMNGLNILTDPVFNDYCGMNRLVGVKRFRPVPCTIDQLPQIDAVIISHNHYDHLDYTTVLELNRKFPESIHWYVPMGQGDWIKSCGCQNVKEMEWWDQSTHPTSKGNDVAFIFTPTQHWCKRAATDDNKALWGSWTIIGPRHRVFFGGDTGYCDVFKAIGKKYGPFDLAAIPIGAYHPRWFMQFQHVDPQQAVQIHKDLQAKTSMAVHWGTFALANEHYLSPPKELKEAMKSEGIPQSDFIIMKHGETQIIGESISQKDVSFESSI
ncbi:N-acyl-phosphatidylethanolamine-hydrolyzing phospholipase D [Nematostella vectensis]|uniref:N-acyl-phosphatidylethanolamine-hydrolyzing phospholipase D n=1 Tax=Nematostella vectensis TaxID=45351 RepID=UPI00207725AD|nr:N-acyl-phosphatidylethanolamine-hydrolyzing phospholipase D [Nematostella vectensis]